MQAVVRQGPLFFEAPTVALWEYARRRPARHDGGVVRARHVHPQRPLRRRRVLRDPGDARVHLGDAPVRQPARHLAAARALRGGRAADVVRGPRRVVRRLVPPGRGALRRRAARGGRRPISIPQTAIKALQLAFAVYQASNERRPVAPDAIDGAVSPVGWPPNGEDLRRDVEEMMAREQARAERLGSRRRARRPCARRKLRQWSAGSEAAADHTGEAGRFLTCRGRP